MGIDPGIAVTGYGVIEINGGTARMLDFGAVRTTPEEKKEERLCRIHDGLTNVIKKFKPDAVAIELLFFNRNTKTALSVGEARGVALLAAGRCGCNVFEYTPLQVKECLTGYGRTVKNSLREVVQMELEMEKPPSPIDASDALALAITHHYFSGINEV